MGLELDFINSFIKQMKIRRKKMDYWAKKASKCRRDRYVPSCHCCLDENTCNIQKKYNELLNLESWK